MSLTQLHSRQFEDTHVDIVLKQRIQNFKIFTLIIFLNTY